MSNRGRERRKKIAEMKRAIEEAVVRKGESKTKSWIMEEREMDGYDQIYLNQVVN